MAGPMTPGVRDEQGKAVSASSASDNQWASLPLPCLRVLASRPPARMASARAGKYHHLRFSQVEIYRNDRCDYHGCNRCDLLNLAHRLRKLAKREK